MFEKWSPFPLSLFFTSCGGGFVQFLRAYLVFNAFLLFWGCLGHYVLQIHTYGKLYTSVDRVVDWFPFVPSGQWVLNQGFGPDYDLHGHLVGTATLWHLRLIWFAVAAPVWLLTYASIAFTWRLRYPRNA